MKSTSTSLLTGLGLALALLPCLPAADAPAAPAPAPQLPKALKLENRTWYKLWYLRYTPSKADRARQLVERVAKAGAEAYPTPPIVLEFQTGRWHLLTILKVRDGAQGLDWWQDPDDEKFWQVLARQEGGADKALALFGELMECVQDQHYELATKIDVARP
jgi:hypothetical protein